MLTWSYMNKHPHQWTFVDASGFPILDCWHVYLMIILMLWSAAPNLKIFGSLIYHGRKSETNYDLKISKEIVE